MPRQQIDPGLMSLLRGAGLFSNLLDDDIAYIATRVERLTFKPGMQIFCPGEKARRFYIVSAGEVSIYRTEDRDQVVEMARYVAGDVIGDFDFAIGAARDAFAKAVNDAELVAFPGGKCALDDLAQERPDVVARILLRAIAMISDRLRSTHKLISENAPWVRELKRQIFTDSATGLWSRNFLDEEIAGSLEAPTSIVLIKPDRFKELNDAYGHQAGDEAMTKLAVLLNSETRRLRRGWAVRLRSNETAVVVPRCDAQDALTLAKRLVVGVTALDLSHATGGKPFPLTASVAIGVWPEDGAEWRRLVERAYGVLMRAWRDGGARVYWARASCADGGVCEP